MAENLPRLRTFRVGPKNKKLEEPGGANEPTGYQVLVEYDVPLAELLARNGITLGEEDAALVTPQNFSWGNTGKVEKHFELFDFSFRSEYGRSGVDEAFAHDKLAHFKFQPATLPDLICLRSVLREAYRDQWFESKNILALGSVLTTKEVVKKKGWFSKEVLGTHRHYPELECIAGRPTDVLRLSTTECDADGNWPNETLFLATPL